MQQQGNMLDDLKNIMKEGWLEKESRFLKTWRKYNHSPLTHLGAGSYSPKPHYTPLKTKNSTKNPPKSSP